MITIDDRELTQHPEIEELLGIPYTVDRLEAADYAFLDRNSEPLGIERATVSNLIQKLRSGELESQMYKCQANYASVILLVEEFYDSVGGLLATYKVGNRGYFRTRVFPNTYWEHIKALEIRLSDMGIEIITSPSFKASMAIVRLLHRQRTKPEEEQTLFKKIRIIKFPAKLSNNPSVPRLLALVPRLSEKTAIRLLHKYDSIWTIIHTPDKEVLEIEGMGKSLLKKLKEGIGKPE